MASIAHRVQPGSFLTLHYRLAGPGGDIINTFGDQPATLTLGTGELSPAVEQRLLGLGEGEHAIFEIPAGRSLRRPQSRRCVQWVARKLLNQMGDAAASDTRWATWCSSPRPTAWASMPARCSRSAQDGGGDGQADAVLFDFNHPLAGQPVTFEVQVIGVL